MSKDQIKVLKQIVTLIFILTISILTFAYFNDIQFFIAKYIYKANPVLILQDNFNNGLASLFIFSLILLAFRNSISKTNKKRAVNSSMFLIILAVASLILFLFVSLRMIIVSNDKVYFKLIDPFYKNQEIELKNIKDVVLDAQIEPLYSGGGRYSARRYAGCDYKFLVLVNFFDKEWGYTTKMFQTINSDKYKVFELSQIMRDRNIPYNVSMHNYDSQCGIIKINQFEKEIEDSMLVKFQNQN